MIDREWSVLTVLPGSGDRVMCYGYKTYCCALDMEDKREWHEVTFSIDMSTYKLKKEIPEDPEESVLEYYNAIESWEIGDEFSDGHVIGVTKWKHLPSTPKE